MMISTVIAVALGLTGVQSPAPASVGGDYSTSVGRYSQFVDRRGTTHVQGFDRRGIPYELVINHNGYVDASVGDRAVSFRVRQ